jgi:hypothetical protein
MKTYLAIAAATVISSAGLYGTGVIWGSDQTSLFEAELTGDQNANAVYPMALDDVYSKLISTPIIDAVGQNSPNDLAPQIIISTQNNRQITWQMKIQNVAVADVVVNLTPESDTTRVTFDINIADNSIITAAAASKDTSVDELKRISRLLVALVVDYRLTGKQINESQIRHVFSAYDIASSANKLAAIRQVMGPSFGAQEPPIEYILPDEQFDDFDIDYSPESITDPTDATIGDVAEEIAAQDAAANAAERAAARAIRRAENDAERAAEMAEYAAQQAEQAAYAARSAAFRN